MSLLLGAVREYLRERGIHCQFRDARSVWLDWRGITVDVRDAGSARPTCVVVVASTRPGHSAAEIDLREPDSFEKLMDALDKVRPPNLRMY